HESRTRREESLASCRGVCRGERPGSAADTAAATLIMDLNSLIQLKRERFEQLEHDIADPCLFDNRKRAEEIMREHASLKQLLAKWAELESVRKQLDDNRELAMSRDVEIAAMADDEIADLEERVGDLRCAIRVDMLPHGA